MGSVFVMGSANTDLTVKAPRLPRPQETVTDGEFMISFGGKGANQALAALFSGASTRLATRIGTDSFGDLLHRHLVQSGLPENGLLRDEESKAGVALIAVDQEGNNQILVAPGSNKRLSRQDIDRLLQPSHGYSVCLAQLEIPLETVLHGMEQARLLGLCTVLDPAPSKPLPSEIYPLLDIITPNEREAAILTGIQIHSPRDAKQAGEWLVRQGCGAAIVTLGTRGAVLCHEGGSSEISAFAVDTVDTVAAGDAFNGALATALAEGRELPEAARFASAAAALSTTQRGAQESLPQRSSIEDLLRKRSA